MPLVLCFLSLALRNSASAGQVPAEKKQSTKTVSPDSGRVRRSYQNDTPETHWAYEGIADMETEGLLRSRVVSIGRGPQPMSAYDFAVMYHAGLTLLEERIERESQLMLDISVGKPRESKALEEQKELAEFINQTSTPLFKRTLEDMERSFTEFDREYRSLGVDVDLLRAAPHRWRSELAKIHIVPIGSALTQFADVPAHHWAAKEVLEMRRLGLLHGYDDGRNGMRFE